MPHPNTIIKIHGAAFYFAHLSRDLREISEATGIGERQIRRYAETPEWDKALDAWGHTGERTFTTQPSRDTIRDNGETFSKARQIYLEAFKAGEPKHKLASLTAEQLGLQPGRVRNWATKYGWRERMHNNEQTRAFNHERHKTP